MNEFPVALPGAQADMLMWAGACKDLHTVIDAQTQGPSPLVEVVARLTTLLCVKG